MQTADADGADRERGSTSGESEEFLAMAVHELRAPVTALVGAAQLLTELGEDRSLPAGAATYLEIIERTGGRLRLLVNDLLSSAYLERGSLPITLESVPLLPVLLFAVGGNVQPSGEVSLDCDANVLVEADAGRLEQIVTNLVANALEHGAAPVEVTASATDQDYVTIDIRDHGEGLRTDDIPHLFERFSPLAARRSSSTGLGLSISRGLARAMGGDISYERADPGSRFILTLRTRSEPQPPVPRQPRSRTSVS